MLYRLKGKNIGQNARPASIFQGYTAKFYFYSAPFLIYHPLPGSALCGSNGCRRGRGSPFRAGRSLADRFSLRFRRLRLGGCRFWRIGCLYCADIIGFAFFAQRDLHIFIRLRGHNISICILYPLPTGDIADGQIGCCTLFSQSHKSEPYKADQRLQPGYDRFSSPRHRGIHSHSR